MRPRLTPFTVPAALLMALLAMSGCSLLDPGLVQVKLVAMEARGTRCQAFITVENSTAQRLESLEIQLTWPQAARQFDGRFVDRTARFGLDPVRSADTSPRTAAVQDLPDRCHVYGAEPRLRIAACQLTDHDERQCIARVRFTDARDFDDPSLIMAIPE